MSTCGRHGNPYDMGRGIEDRGQVCYEASADGYDLIMIRYIGSSIDTLPLMISKGFTAFATTFHTYSD